MFPGALNVTQKLIVRWTAGGVNKKLFDDKLLGHGSWSPHNVRKRTTLLFRCLNIS